MGQCVSSNVLAVAVTEEKVSPVDNRVENTDNTPGSYQSAGAAKKGFTLKATPSSVKADHTKMYNFQSIF